MELAEALQARGVLARLGLTPLLCASATGCVLRPSWAFSHAAAAVQAYMWCVHWHPVTLHVYPVTWREQSSCARRMRGAALLLCTQAWGSASKG